MPRFIQRGGYEEYLLLSQTRSCRLFVYDEANINCYSWSFLQTTINYPYKNVLFFHCKLNSCYCVHLGLHCRGGWKPKFTPALLPTAAHHRSLLSPPMMSAEDRTKILSSQNAFTPASHSLKNEKRCQSSTLARCRNKDDEKQKIYKKAAAQCPASTHSLEGLHREQNGNKKQRMQWWKHPKRRN